MKIYLFSGAILLMLCPLWAQTPSVTIIIVIDQFSAHYLPKLQPYLKGGIGFLARNGSKYVNAFYDHAMPATGPGHYLLSTGTYGSVHGIINNKWFNEQGKEIACDDDSAENAAVFNPREGFYDFGKSARLSLVDNLSDQLIIHSYPHARNTVWALSLKSRAAIAMAGRLGKALWLDDESEKFTSSRAYFRKLPKWLISFNKKIGSHYGARRWNLFYPPSHAAYSFAFLNNHDHSSVPFSYIGKPISCKGKHNREIYAATPHANKDLFDLALTVFEKEYSGKSSERLILWLSLSSLDKVGHIYGPHSKEAIDMIYHMDGQLKGFMEKIYRRAPSKDVLFVLTADHGVQPVPEVLNSHGLDLARRYNDTELIHNLNSIITSRHGIDNFIIRYKEPQFYVNQRLLEALDTDTTEKIYADIKKYLIRLPGIRRAWTFDELQNASFQPYDLDKYLARQLYKGRSGQIIFSVNPYTSIDTHLRGTSHISQYAYDTHVPLIFYQAGTFTDKRIAENVFIPQICVTLATLLNVPRPSAATASVLPGLLPSNHKENL